MKAAPAKPIKYAGDQGVRGARAPLRMDRADRGLTILMPADDGLGPLNRRV
jgi:hypothetical protein